MLVLEPLFPNRLSWSFRTATTWSRISGRVTTAWAGTLAR
uniref:Uncharacterized protein n=1 Tax=Anguilla anguilla TaxID=7936 RepID=A0A0E9XYS1_ANGAN